MNGLAHHHRGLAGESTGLRIQERAFGGLKPRCARSSEDIGETGILPEASCGDDALRLLPGTILTRIYDDIEHHVLVRGTNDFEYHGQRFKSLSAIAKVHHGQPLVGPCVLRPQKARIEEGDGMSSPCAINPADGHAEEALRRLHPQVHRRGLDQGIQQPRSPARRGLRLHRQPTAKAGSPVGDGYDDGGYSGGNMERPGCAA